MCSQLTEHWKLETSGMSLLSLNLLFLSSSHPSSSLFLPSSSPPVPPNISPLASTTDSLVILSLWDVFLCLNCLKSFSSTFTYWCVGNFPKCCTNALNFRAQRGKSPFPDVIAAGTGIFRRVLCSYYCYTSVFHFTLSPRCHWIPRHTPPWDFVSLGVVFIIVTFVTTFHLLCNIFHFLSYVYKV